MYIEFDARNSISVPEPYKRVLTTYLMPETAPIPLPFSVHLCEWEPGQQNDMHAHKVETEVMYVLSGHGKAFNNGEEVALAPGGMLVAAPGEEHVIINNSGETLRLLCIFSPPTTRAALKERADQAQAEYNANVAKG